MTAFAFTILLTFMSGLHYNKPVEVHCRDAQCVAVIEEQARADGAVQRFQVWRADDYAPLGAGAFVWPPMQDERFS